MTIQLLLIDCIACVEHIGVMIACVSCVEHTGVAQNGLLLLGLNWDAHADDRLASFEDVGVGPVDRTPLKPQGQIAGPFRVTY